MNILFLFIAKLEWHLPVHWYIWTLVISFDVAVWSWKKAFKDSDR